jgi:hypothetical protein|tara:strand:- start:2997 stop:3290 length:294 start_codon:yes stop_codon:yes gene_type:complete
MLSIKTTMPDDFKVTVGTTNNRGHTPSEVAEMCVNKLMYVSENAPPAIRDQAVFYKNELFVLIEHYMKQAVASDRTNVINALTNAGSPQLAEMIRRL